jgi:zinc transporter ZupT
MQNIKSAKRRTIIVKPKKQTIKKAPSNETDRDTATLPNHILVDETLQVQKLLCISICSINPTFLAVSTVSKEFFLLFCRAHVYCSKYPPSSGTAPSYVRTNRYLQIHSPRPSMPMTLLHSNHHIISSHSRQSHLMHFHEPSIAEPLDENELKSDAFLALLGGWANNFIDGMTVGASFADNPIRGLAIGLAILSQHFPNEIG